MPTKYVVGICCVANVAAGNWEFDEASSTNLIAEGIDHSKPQILKVALIARCDLGTTGQGDACDQRVAQIHRCTPGFALGSKVGGFVSRQSIQGSDPALHQLPKKQLNTLLKPGALRSYRKNGQPAAQLKHHDAGQPDLIGRLLVKPANYPWIWTVLHHSRNYIGVEQDHALKSAGSAS